MNQRRTSNLTTLGLGLGLLCAGACGDDGTGAGLGSLSTASPATTAELMPGCLARNAAVAPGPLVVSPKTLNIWPPNHKFHTIDVADCVTVTGVCDPGVTAEFIWGSSDEPVDSLGDGHFSPDILFDGCDHVQVRSERQGPKDGRVYKLGVRVIDGAGHASEAACTVVVDHDQRGVRGADSGESYRIVPTSAQTGLACAGRAEPPPVIVPPASPDAGVTGPSPIGI
ncbi:MAG: hypothetical protein JWN48_1990 [Myxococcaceae bacterium]|nr:hypothetical protein [Myxococcaceae bacterium]